MFIKSITKSSKKTGVRYTYYRLCESYRFNGMPRHRAIINLGDLSELPNKEDYKYLADRIEQIIRGQEPLFLCPNPVIDKLARGYAQRIINQGLIDTPLEKREAKEKAEAIATSDYQNIDINSIRHKECKEVGAEWMCKQMLNMLGIEGQLEAIGWKRHWIKIAMIYLIARGVYPASERRTAKWLKKNTALCDLYNIEAKKVSRHKLYKASKMLYEDKDRIQSGISNQTGELFKIEDKIVIYDLTNTYFEGRKEGSEKAKYGRSKDGRKDAKLLSLAMAVDTYGFPMYSKIYEGNIRESKTLAAMIQDIRNGRGEGKAEEQKVIVMDAGIATEDNLKMLRGQGYDYVCVPLSKPSKDKQRQWAIDEHSEMPILKDNRGNKIYVKWVETETEDNLLYIKSEQKEKKERSMEALHCSRYEEDLNRIQEGIKKKGGVKNIQKVYERLGRVKERYPTVHRLYEVKVDSKEEKATEIKWVKTKDRSKEQGIYFIRTTLKDTDEETVWKIYNTIREVEATFRVLKTDLRIRPIHHQRDLMSESHIFGGVMAYMIVNSIRHMLKAKGIKESWGEIIRTMNTQKVVMSSMRSKSGHTIYIKKCSDPDTEAAEIYRALNFKDRPFWEKKSVLPETEKLKTQGIDTT